MSGLTSALRSGFPLELLSKHRNAIYGFCIVWIVLFHSIAINKVYDLYYEPGFYWLYFIIDCGNVGVDVFLFLSGISLFYSFSKNPDIKRFYSKRLTRIVPSAWLIYTLYWFIRYIVLNFDLGLFVSRMTLMRFWVTGDQTMWFVSAIIAFYLLYPLIYKWLFFKPEYQLLRFIVLLAVAYGGIILIAKCFPGWYGNVEIALTRLPVFLMGCYAGKFVKEGKRIHWLIAALAIIGVAVFFIVLDMKLVKGTSQRFFYAFGGVTITVFLALFFEICERLTKNPDLGLIRFFTWVGGFSLELYLAHIMLNQVLRLQPFYIKGDFIQYAAMACCALVLAWATKRVIDTAHNRLQKRKALPCKSSE